MGLFSRILRLRGPQPAAAHPPRGFMWRLANDVRANTLALMGISIIPLAGMVGGGIDISRMYILKTRLQHACDAGALAGRKTMGGGTWNQTVNGVSNYPNAKAIEFFDGNFLNGSYGSYDRTRSFTENAGKVTGTASAKIPMTLMKVFKRPDETITVTCTADMRLPNTDVMFVLDTTGSMASPQPGDTVSKMDALKTAVKCFYEIVARLDTDANCTTGTPAGGTGSQVQIRFGFVPYSTNVNVGKLLKPEWFASSWKYQTRVPRWWIMKSQTVSNDPVSANNVPQTSCNNQAAAAAGYNSNTDKFEDNNKKKTNTTVETTVTGWNASNGGTCSGTQKRTTTVYEWREGGSGTPNDQFIEYRYAQHSLDISGLKNGTSWNSSLQLPVGDDGANQTLNWDGCIEERETVRAASYDPIPSDAKDLDIDLVPTSDVKTQWGPALHGVIFPRDNNANATGNTVQYNNTPQTVTKQNFKNNTAYVCAAEARKLAIWNNADAFDSYVDGLNPGGNTYHDIGLVWGARFLSPTGLFASENAFTPQGGEIERHLIFMTDGDACTENYNYAAYGIAWFDRRQTDPNTVPTGGCTSTGTLTQQVNLRTEGLCTAIKNKNITLWVVAFGSLASSTVTRLTNCASPGRYFTATNSAGLQQTFKTIADQISSLRLTQ